MRSAGSSVDIVAQHGFVGVTGWTVNGISQLFVDAVVLWDLDPGDPTMGDLIELELTGGQADDIGRTATFQFKNESIDDPDVDVMVEFELRVNVHDSILIQTVVVENTGLDDFEGRIFSYQDFDLDGSFEDQSVAYTAEVQTINQNARDMTTLVSVEVVVVSMSDMSDPPPTDFEMSLDGSLGFEILIPGGSGLAPELDNAIPPTGPADFEFAYGWDPVIGNNDKLKVVLRKKLTVSDRLAVPGLGDSGAVLLVALLLLTGAWSWRQLPRPHSR